MAAPHKKVPPHIDKSQDRSPGGGKLFRSHGKLQKGLLSTKAIWKALHHYLMEDFVLKENEAVNFRFFFQQRLDSKRKTEKYQKSKNMKSNRSFQQTNTEHEDLSFTKQIFILRNLFKDFVIDD